MMTAVNKKASRNPPYREYPQKRLSLQHNKFCKGFFEVKKVGKHWYKGNIHLRYNEAIHQELKHLISFSIAFCFE
jgi:hypothetical protein